MWISERDKVSRRLAGECFRLCRLERWELVVQRTGSYEATTKCLSLIFQGNLF